MTLTTPLLLLSLALAVTPAPPKKVHELAGLKVEVLGDLKGFSLDLTSSQLEPDLHIIDLKLSSATAAAPPTFTLEWAIPSVDVAGHWTTGSNLNKYVRPDFSSSRLL